MIIAWAQTYSNTDTMSGTTLMSIIDVNIYRSIAGDDCHGHSCRCELFNGWQTHDLGEYWSRFSPMMPKTKIFVTPGSPYGAIWEQCRWLGYYIPNDHHQYQSRCPHCTQQSNHCHPGIVLLFMMIIITIIITSSSSSSSPSSSSKPISSSKQQHQHY